MSMQYYFYMSESDIISVHRVDLEAEPIVLERWDGKAWKWHPATLDVIGFSSNAFNFEETTKAKAEKYIWKK